eukprot:CAMPEP_0171227890 /NCGR_PEP_ID=MMETSP0790-20130122/38080_1 /TAXON_ID=2925 /ORGANISM="Alexandrium catenella, Strain OF101" /LENGTH=209 /DNA_ID=CAMNT_0011694017 /DNA_START=61 /DNA_END=686 /DNA_ORIENTATION=+
MLALLFVVACLGDAARSSTSVSGSAVKSRGARGAVLSKADADLRECEAHLQGIERLQLDPSQATSIVKVDCPKRFKLSVTACDKVGTLFAAGQLGEACKLVVSASVNMTAICEQAAAKVAAVDLEGEALRQAAAAVCTKEVQASAPLATENQTQAGCLYFAQRLDEAQHTGPLDVPRFCAALVAASTEAFAEAPPAEPAAGVVSAVATA